MIRSFLFIPADSDRKLQKAADIDADAFILDLEDAVSADALPAARERAKAFVEGKDNVWVRINPIDSPESKLDLDSIMPSAPAGIVLPKPRSAEAAIKLATKLTKLEEQHNVPAGSTAVLPLCTERAEALFTLHTYVGATERLYGLSWGAEDLAASVGASTNRDDNGNWLPTYEMARSFCLLAASAANVAAIDTIFSDFRNDTGLRKYAADARRDGFSGMLAIHPAQVDPINEAFVPSAEEIAHAKRIVALFDDNAGSGAIGLDGKMVDRPHLVQAKSLLELAHRIQST